MQLTGLEDVHEYAEVEMDGELVLVEKPLASEVIYDKVTLKLVSKLNDEGGFLFVQAAPDPATLYPDFEWFHRDLASADELEAHAELLSHDLEDAATIEERFPDPSGDHIH